MEWTNILRYGQTYTRSKVMILIIVNFSYQGMFKFKLIA